MQSGSFIKAGVGLRALVALLGWMVVGCASMPLASVKSAVNPETWLLRQVRVFDGEVVVPQADVLIRSGRIERVEVGGGLEAPEGASVQSGEGLTLLPGLTDMHMHLFGPGAAPWAPALVSPEALGHAFLYAGVTRGLVASSNKADFELRLKAEQGAALAPQFYLAGPGLTAPGGHPLPLLKALLPKVLHGLVTRAQPVASTPEEARREVQKVWNAYHLPFYKLFLDALPPSTPKLRQDILLAAVDEARRLGMRPIAHVGSSADMLEAAQAGVSLLVHVAYSDRLSDEQVATLASLQVPFVPTLQIFAGLNQAALGHFSPLAREIVPAEALEALHHRPASYRAPLWEQLEPLFPSYVENARDNTKRLIDAGVPFFVGTDTGVPGVYPGAALHSELDALASLGIAPLTLLKRVTAAGAELLEPGSNGARIVPGARADLLLVRGNPDEDLAAIHQIEAVFVAGKRLERQAQPLK